MISKKWHSKLRNLAQLKAKFAATSFIATSIDYGLFAFFVYFIFNETAYPSEISHITSYSISVLINFTLQKRFVFSMQRGLNTTFLLSLLVSLGGLLLSTLLIFLLVKITFFAANPLIAKLCVTGLIFFYNFYLKRYVFEKKFL